MEDKSANTGPWAVTASHPFSAVSKVALFLYPAGQSSLGGFYLEL